MEPTSKHDQHAAADLQVIAQHQMQVDQIEADTRRLVMRLRERWVPWADIAVALGCTRQAAQQRYGRRAEMVDTAP